MDHERSYAFHIAQAIRHKKAMKDAPATEEEDIDQGEEGLEMAPLGDDDPPLEPKAARKERIKAILAR